MSISKIEALFHENENAFIEKRNFLICSSCFWCVSCFTGNRTIMNCPSCGNKEMQLNPIADYKSYKLDDEFMKEIASQFWPNPVGEYTE